jgi:hypothetical protein
MTPQSKERARVVGKQWELLQRSDPEKTNVGS